MDWTSWSQTWSTKSTTTTSRRPLKRRRKCSRWRRKYSLLQADQRLKTNREDLPLLAHLQELYLFVKENGLISCVPSGKKTKHSSSAWMDKYLEKKMGRSNSGDWKMIFGTNLIWRYVEEQDGLPPSSSRSFRTQSHWSYTAGNVLIRTISSSTFIIAGVQSIHTPSQI